MNKRLTTKFPGGHDAFGMPMATTYDLDLQSAEGRIKARCTLGRIEDILFDESGAEVLTIDRLREIAAAEREGRVQIIDKTLFCRNAGKRGGKCAGYHENMFSHATLRMCARCGDYDPDTEEADYYEDIGEEDENNRDH